MWIPALQDCVLSFSWVLEPYLTTNLKIVSPSRNIFSSSFFFIKDMICLLVLVLFQQSRGTPIDYFSESEICRTRRTVCRTKQKYVLSCRMSPRFFRGNPINRSCQDGSGGWFSIIKFIGQRAGFCAKIPGRALDDFGILKMSCSCPVVVHGKWGRIKILSWKLKSSRRVGGPTYLVFYKQPCISGATVAWRG